MLIFERLLSWSPINHNRSARACESSVKVNKIACGSLKQYCAAGADRIDSSLIPRLEATRANESGRECLLKSLAAAQTQGQQNRLSPPTPSPRRANTGQWKILHTHDETRRDYACFGSGGSSATTASKAAPRVTSNHLLERPLLIRWRRRRRPLAGPERRDLRPQRRVLALQRTSLKSQRREVAARSQ